MDKISTKALGFLAENIAARYLESQGYQVVERNYRKPWGEIDVIAIKDKNYIFAEVKANRRAFASADFNPEARVNRHKLGQIIKTASLYLEQEVGKPDQAWQVDVISVTFNRDQRNAKIKHFKNVAADYQ